MSLRDIKYKGAMRIFVKRLKVLMMLMMEMVMLLLTRTIQVRTRASIFRVSGCLRYFSVTARIGASEKRFRFNI